MAVIVSDNTNPAYDGNLSTVNGFYRVEHHNLRAYYGDLVSIANPQYIPLTFANGGVFKGFATALTVTSAACNRSISTTLQEAKTATMAVSSPGIVTIATHGLSEGQEIIFLTTGALLTGITAGTIYYVRYIDVNTFNISTTPSGALINFTGTQSGVHTCWITRDTSILTYDQVLTPKTGVSSLINMYTWIPFKFVGGYTVDTSASKWQIRIIQTGGTAGSYNINHTIASGTIYPCVAWCNNQVSFIDDDALVVVDLLEIDQTASIKGVLSSGDTTEAIASVVCRSLTPTEDGISLLRWKRAPAASYTFTVDGCIICGKHAGVECGTRLNPIPYAQQAIWYFKTKTVGTYNSRIKSLTASTGSRPSGRGGVVFCGEVPTYRYGILAQDANTGQDKIVLTEDLSSEWQVGDRIYVGKNDITGQGSVTVNTITSFNGTEITLNANVATNNRLAGGIVINFSRGYGIKAYSQSNADPGMVNLNNPNFLIFTGVYALNFNLPITTDLVTYFLYEGNPEYSVYEINDNLAESTGTGVSGFVAIAQLPDVTTSIQRNLAFRTSPLTALGAYYGALRKSGRLLYKDNKTCAGYTSGPGAAGTINYKADFLNNTVQNAFDAASIYSQFTVAGIGCTYKNNVIWGCNLGFLMSSSINAVLENNTVDKCRYDLALNANSVIINAKDKNSSYGTNAANGSTYINVGITGNITIDSPAGVLNVDTTNILDTTPGFKLAITESGDVANTDLVYTTYGYFVRCGDSLTDTTVHTSGTGKFSLRFEPIDSVEPLSWEQFIPTGNIQGLTMSVSVWIKIASATYYAGTHINPTLEINYDNGTVVSSAAANSTDWQLVTVSFSPVTTYGQVKITVGGATDALTTDAYFYIDDINVFYPPGISLSLGNLDLWADALPITPSISTGVNAMDVWSAATNSLTSTGSIGKLLADNINADIAGVETKIDTIVTNVGVIDSLVDDIIKLTGNNVIKSGNMITIYEADGVTPWRVYDLTGGGRIIQ